MSTITKEAIDARLVLDVLLDSQEAKARVAKNTQFLLNSYDQVSAFHNTVIDGYKITVTKPSERLNVSKQPDVVPLQAQINLIKAQIKLADVRSANGQRPVKGDAQLLKNVTKTKVRPSFSIKEV